MLAVCLLLWAETGLAMSSAPGRGRRCHAHMQHMERASASIPDAMTPGCCPRHMSSKPACPSHSLPSPHQASRPDCCSLTNQPVRPLAFLIASGSPLSLESSTTLLLDFRGDPSQDRGSISIAESAPQVRAVLDQKADLRI